MSYHFKTKDNFKTINNSFDIEEVYNATLEAVFTEQRGEYTPRIKSINIIKESYITHCKANNENKIKIYQLFKVIKQQKSYNLLENEQTINALKTLINLHYYWIRIPLDWKKLSRNPFKQMKSLINHLMCKHEVPNFLYNQWYKPITYKKEAGIGITWFIHLASGKSAKNLVGLNFVWTKKMAHEFINSPDEIEIKDAIIRSISKISGGSERLYSYFYISKIQEGILSEKIQVAEFWINFIEYFSKQVMFDPFRISHIADYVYSIKFDTSLGRTPEKPNFDIRKKNLGTLVNESEIWVEQLNRLARAAGMARRGALNIGNLNLKRNEQYINTSWSPSNWINNWSYSRKIKIKKTNYVINHKMIELCTGAQLLEEGRAMNHCVFSYIGSCSTGKCRIFSLREIGTKSSILTIEVRGNIISQIRGKDNRPMSAEEKLVVSDWAIKAGCTFAKYY